MGIGSSPAGSGPAGLDLPASTDQRIAATPAALEFDGQTKDFSLDANGRFVSKHPIDSKVFHRLRIIAGTMRSAPATGQGISGKWIRNETIESFVRDQVTLTLADMVDAGDIAVRNITVDTAVRGRVLFQVDYVNMRSGRPDSFRST